jgi:kynurenine formamidase
MPPPFPAQRENINELPLDVMISPARVIEIEDTETIKTNELATQNIQAGERLLFKKPNSSKAYQTNEFNSMRASFTSLPMQHTSSLRRRYQLLAWII